MNYDVNKEKMNVITLEDRLANKFDWLQQARENEDAKLFDELVKSIIVLFKAKPSAHQEFMLEKTELDKELIELMQSIDYAANQATDEIYRQATLNEKFPLQWQYRESLEEMIMELMEKYNLIPMKDSKPAIVEPVIEKYTPVAVESIQQPPEPIPEVKKPKFMRKKVKPKVEPEESFTV